MTQIDFPVFVASWNELQGMSTPRLHFRMSAWLAERWAQGDRRLLLLAFRDSGKSTLVGLFCAWLLACDPNLRILVLAADHALARKMVRNVKRIVERHPLTRGLKPTKVDEWASDQFTVARPREFRDPSMLARGIGANITGSRADVVICDDVEVPNTSDTARKREDLRARLDETDFVLVPGGLSIFVGTPHTYHSIYAAEPRTAAGEAVPYLYGYARLEVPVIDAAARSAWPERFPLGRIEAMRERAGPNKFASQMLLMPVDLADGRLDPDKLCHYDAELDYREGNGEALLFLGDRRLVSATCWWDPAYGAPGRGDASVVAAVFTDEDGGYWLHAVEYLEHDPRAVQAVDEATQLCRQAVQVVRRNFLPAITLETNGLGRFLPGLLRREMSAAGIEAAVIEHTSTRPKDLRILDAFDAVLAAGRLHAHRRVWDTPFVSEMREWRPAAGVRDDGLDAVAGCLLAEPVRLPRRARTWGAGRRRSWRVGARPVAARTDFRP